MDAVLEELRDISIADLRTKWLNYGESLGPITANMKMFYIKRLAKKIVEERGLNTQQTGCEERINSPHTMHIEAHETTTDTHNGVKADSGMRNRDPPLQQSTALAAVYYGISLPEGCTPSSDETRLVFTDRKLALEAVKKYKGARFKMFQTEEEAEIFSGNKTTLLEKSEADDESPNRERLDFKAPKNPELVKFRKVIEEGDLDSMVTLAWGNPRYLVGSGDTPVVLQEGFRYNALHIAAKHNRPELCQVVIDILENPDFFKTMYVFDTEQTRSERINFLVDLYINTPDKGNYESPLHFACKFGHAAVVEVLTAHPKTDRCMRNKFGEAASDVICSRCSDKSQSMVIAELLQGQYYVPLMRSHDNSTQPVIGYPWSPDQDESPVSLTTVQPLVVQSPKDPVMSVKACAGPMSPAKAELFHKNWSSPSTNKSDVRRNFEIKRTDLEKGLERIGRNLAHDLRVPWTEFWEFLGTNIDLSTPQGLDILENYLQNTWNTELFFSQTEPYSHGRSERQNDSAMETDDSFADLSTDVQRDGNASFSLDISNEMDSEDSVEYPGITVVDTSPILVYEKSWKYPEENRFAYRDSSFSHTSNRINSVHSTPVIKTKSCDNVPSSQLHKQLSRETLSPTSSDKLLCELSDAFEVKLVLDSNRNNHAHSMRCESDVSQDMLVIDSEGKKNVHQITAVSNLAFVPQGSEVSTPDRHVSDSVERQTFSTPKSRVCIRTPTTGLFIHGYQATKQDLDVLRALANIEIDASTHPNVSKWRHLVSSFAQDTQQRWPSPARSHSRAAVGALSRNSSDNPSPSLLARSSPKFAYSPIGRVQTPVRHLAHINSATPAHLRTNLFNSQ